MDGTKEIAQRLVNGEENFIETLMDVAKITRDEAVKAFATFRKVRAVKLQFGLGRWTVKHGAFMDRVVIRRAAGLEG